MYALVDCNNFYCSCERVFNPKLEGRPVIVLSNNDGCAIARSEEAKLCGVAMGTPAFMVEPLVKKHRIAVFSSNYTLYGDMSDRVMKTLAAFCTGMEIYSIDEAFLDLHDMQYADLLKLGMKVLKTVKQHTGIPTTVGIAPTKTLAKMANRFAKKRRKDTGVFWAANDDLVNEMLHFTEIRDVWGIGHQYALLLQKNGFRTAADFIQAPEEWVRVNMSVVGQRLLNELKGVPSVEWEFEPAAKKNICTSRSFGKLMTRKEDVSEALSNYAAICGLKLRKQNSCCKTIQVFIQTNPHKLEHKQYSRSIKLQLETASSNTAEIIRHSLKGLDIIFKEGYEYMKCGIIVMDLVPEKEVQQSLFGNPDRKKSNLVMQALDKINSSMGKDMVRMAVQGFEKRYKLKAAHLSPCYTTNFKQLLKVQI